ncbi:uncharacterized protein DS421_13g424800 [Arachis hypogaea]|nr:uncharacterized protein DS421_13g424800 [Arachis hypogaea]
MLKALDPFLSPLPFGLKGYWLFLLAFLFLSFSFLSLFFFASLLFPFFLQAFHCFFLLQESIL